MGKLTIAGKDITKQYAVGTKKVVSWTMNGKVCTFAASTTGAVSYTGDFIPKRGKTAAQIQAEFEALTDTVTAHQFAEQSHLTTVNLGGVKTIGLLGFHNTYHLTSMVTDNLETIGESGIRGSAKTASANQFPKLKYIGEYGLSHTMSRGPATFTFPELLSVDEYGLDGFGAVTLHTLILPKVQSLGINSLNDISHLDTVIAPHVTSFPECLGNTNSVKTLFIPRVTDTVHTSTHDNILTDLTISSVFKDDTIMSRQFADSMRQRLTFNISYVFPDNHVEIGHWDSTSNFVITGTGTFDPLTNTVI